MARYVLSPEAVRDLVELEEFLTEREGSGRALSVLARLHRAMTSLADYPGMGRLRRDLARQPMCYPVQSWVIFYRPTPERTAIEIIRVLDGRRDLNSIMDNAR
jgi:toxin ParE1/3/4